MIQNIASACNICIHKDICVFREIEEILSETIDNCVIDPDDYIKINTTVECKKFVMKKEDE